MSKLLIVVLDGCATDYISRENTPNFFHMAKSGFCKRVKSAVPSIHSVNHATILTGEFPAKHGVFAAEDKCNPLKNSGVETIFQIYNKMGKSTALLTTYNEMIKEFGCGLKFGICTESPKEILVRFINMEMPPKVRSLEENLWVMEATHNLIKKNNPDLVYCTTSDYLAEHVEVNSKEAVEYMKKVDYWLGKILELDEEREIYITADHGRKKPVNIINFQNFIMGNQTLFSETRYVVEGGLLFLYLNKATDELKEKISLALKENTFVDQIFTGDCAAEKYKLPIDKVGDFMVMPIEGYAFGEAYEMEIPLIAMNPREVPQKYRFSRDIVKIIKDNL